jgi:phosphoglycerate dehydrogenase-like enzyme
MSFAYMLALSRELFLADRMTKQGHWIKHDIVGYLLANKTLGIVGLGNIGTKVAQMGTNWDMEVIGCVEHPTEERVSEYNGKGIRLTSFDEVISKSDYISIHVPLKDSTRNIINADVLSQMKPGVIIINLSRGGVVDEDALQHAMTNGGNIRGVALYVHKQEGEGKVSPLACLPNVILTPHIGAMTIDTQREIGRRILETVDQYIDSHSLD